MYEWCVFYILSHRECWLLHPEALQDISGGRRYASHTTATTSSARHSASKLFVAVAPESGWPAPIAAHVQTHMHLRLQAKCSIVIRIQMVVQGQIQQSEAGALITCN